MITIKMQANSTVTYALNRIPEDDCLLVDNYPIDNDIWHLPIEYEYIKVYKTESSVGCRRVKPTDK